MLLEYIKILLISNVKIFLNKNKTRLQLINRIAAKLNVKKILFATTCTKLTIELLNNVAIGKGAHLSQEMVNNPLI